MNTGQTTPNIGIYCPAAGEENYEQAFTEGMVNVDQHDHSGGPNKGLPIATNGLGAFSVTFDKLNQNVVDPDTGVGVSGLFPNQIVMLDPLKAIFEQAPDVGFITMDGTNAHVRTFADSATVTWTNANGASGNPTANVNIAGISPVTVPNGGTGRTTLTPYALLAGGTSNTSAVQSLAGLGTANQVLTSNGPAALPTFQSLPSPPAQNLLTAQITLTASQFKSLTTGGMTGTGIQVVPNGGSGTILVPYNAWAKLIYGGVDVFHGGDNVTFYYGSGLSREVGMRFEDGCFKDAETAYYSCGYETPSSTSGFTTSQIENRSIYVSVDGSNFTGGSGNSVVISVQYSILTLPS